MVGLTGSNSRWILDVGSSSFYSILLKDAHLVWFKLFACST
jgi:hypothetical protein